MAKIGLLGGSFNPAHAGHLHLSQEALKRLQLDAVWWLVSPQNPLKPTKGMAGFKERFASAEAITRSHPRIHISDFERKAGTQYTADTLAKLQATHAQHQFTWLMGADNLAQMHRWYQWQEIMQNTPVAVFDRAPFSHAALRSPMAQKYHHFRIDYRKLTQRQAPCWSMIFMPRHSQSSTQIRNLLGKHNVLGHN